MRKKLEQLLSETYDYTLPKMILPKEEISLETEKGKSLRGFFSVESPTSSRIRGFVYSSSPRFIPEDPTFSGRSVQIRFRADATGLLPGEKAEGIFTLASNLGEEKVRVLLSVTEKTLASPPDFSDLTDKARMNFETAAYEFASERFGEQMKRAPWQLRTLYEALKEEQNSSRALEEFLIGAGLKDSIEITVAKSEYRIQDPKRAVRAALLLIKSTWGYLELSVSSDNEFLRPEKKTLTTADFAGNACDLYFIVDPRHMHPGRNYGRITIHSCYQTLTFDVLVERGTSQESRQHHLREMSRCRALRLYMDYRIGRIDLRKWAERTIAVVEDYHKADGQDVYADLLQVFALQADGRKSRAERLLSEVLSQPRRLNTPDRYVFALYLYTYFTRDSAYINEVRMKCRKFYLEDRHRWVIRWVQLYLLEDEIGRGGAKLETILNQIDLGCSSPLMYLEAALVLAEDPFLLHEITPSSRQVLNFAVKQGLVTDKLAMQVSSLVLKKPEFDLVLFRVLGQIYSKIPLRDVLKAMCSMAISGNLRDEKYFSLYQTALNRDIRVTGLYEFYLEACGDRSIEEMPEVIRRFFLYSDALDYRKKASLFRRLCASKDRNVKLYQGMESAIEKFTLDQLSQGHISEDLAVLYKKFLRKSLLTGGLSRKLARILFSYQVQLRNPDMTRVLVADSRLPKVKSYQVLDGCARVRIHSAESRILLEDGEGRRYASTSLYMAEHTLDSPVLLGVCSRLIPEDPHLILYYVLNGVGKNPVNTDNLSYYENSLGMSLLSQDFQRRVRGYLLDYYYENPDGETLFHFLKKIRLETYAEIDVEKIVNLLARQGMYEEACSLVFRCGSERIPPELLVRVCAQTALLREYEENPLLLSYCAYCFGKGKYDEHILSYLLLYYDGPVEEMKKLWSAGVEYGLDTMNLEQKILSMIVFTEEGLTGSEEIYASFRKSLGNRKIIKAYRNLFCYESLVHGLKAERLLFDDILKEYEHGSVIPDTAALALLKDLSEREELSEDQLETAEDLLETYSDRGMRFGFFKNFPRSVRENLNLEGKVFLEYTADPSSYVEVCYRRPESGEAFRKEKMRNVFEGLFVREFVLFEGEVLEYFCEEMTSSGERIRSDRRMLTGGEVPEDLRSSSYGRICAMRQAYLAGDTEGYQEKMEEYRQLQSVAREIFTLV